MIGISIIGLGAIGERLMPIFKEYEELEVVSVYDIDSTRMKTICQAYEVEAAVSIEAILEDPKVQGVYLAVPPKFHKTLAFEIMKAGKHILCEKPLAGTISEAKAMMDLASETNVVNCMNFPLYFGPGYAKLKALLDDKAIGQIKRIELKGIFPDWPRKWQVNPWIDSKDQGGFVREVFTHFIQLTHDYFGYIELDHVDVIYPNDPTKSESDIYGRGHIGQIPMVFNGMTGVGHEEDLKLVIWGSEGVIEFVNWRDIYVIDKEKKVSIELDAYNATYHLIDAFRKAMEGATVSLVDFEAGYHAVKVVETMLNQ